MTFMLEPNANIPEITDAINYLLANLQSSLNQNVSNGQITNSSGGVVSYLYRFLDVKYANSFNGTVGFGDSPIGMQYYGLRNSSSPIESTNPADYTWYQVAGGFGISNQLYYLTTGGRQIQLRVSSGYPASNWLIDPGTAIDLDIVSSTSSTTSNQLAMLGMDGEDGQDGMMIQIPVSGSSSGLLAVAGGLTSVTTIAATLTDTTGGITLGTQSALVGQVWRITAMGQFTAVSSATTRNANITAYWGSTALPNIAPPVLVSVAQTTNWIAEFVISASSTTAVWTTGYLENKIDFPATVLGVSSPDKLDMVTPASTTVTSGPQTIDLRFSMSTVVAGDQWLIQSVIIERVK